MTLITVVRWIKKRISLLEVKMFVGWVLTIHIFEALMLPSLSSVRQILPGLSFADRFILIWAKSADANYYLSIAQKGVGAESFVFFPMWPLLLSLLGATPVIAKIAAVLLTLGFLIIFCKWIVLTGFEKHKTHILLTVLAYPFSFMLLSPLSEPLFLLLTAATFWFVKQKKFWLAAICAALAGATRMIGIILFLYLFLVLWQEGKKTFKRYWAVIPTSTLGLILYCLFLQVKYGDFLLFYKHETLWDRQLGLNSIATSIKEVVEFATGTGRFEPTPVHLLHFGAVFFFIFLAVLAYRKLDRATWWYCIISILIPLASGTFLGIPRYLLGSFPLFVPLGIFLSKHQVLFYGYLALSFMLQGYLLIQFFNFQMVA